MTTTPIDPLNLDDGKSFVISHRRGGMSSHTSRQGLGRGERAFTSNLGPLTLIHRGARARQPARGSGSGGEEERERQKKAAQYIGVAIDRSTAIDPSGWLFAAKKRTDRPAIGPQREET
jgi:hypothetical protein